MDKLEGAAVRHCMHRALYAPEAGFDGSVSVHACPNTGRARFGGLQRCGSVWLCPVCTHAISIVRQGEMNRALAWGREQPGLWPVMLTLTVRHRAGDTLSAVLGDLTAARKLMQQRKVWRNLRKAGIIAGSITAQEVTHGGHGWHPHVHSIVFVRASDEAEAIELVEGCRSDWSDLAAKRGRAVTSAGFQVQGAAEAGSYVSKWGAAEELALSGQKSGREKVSRTPWQLLADAEAGDCRAARLWLEYAQTFHGRRQLVWSRGLKDLIGLDDVTDEEAAAEELDLDAEVEVGRIPNHVWRVVAARHAQSALLDYIENTPHEERGVALLAFLDALLRDGVTSERPPDTS